MPSPDAGGKTSRRKNDSSPKREKVGNETVTPAPEEEDFSSPPGLWGGVPCEEAEGLTWGSPGDPHLDGALPAPQAS